MRAELISLAQILQVAVFHIFKIYFQTTTNHTATRNVLLTHEEFLIKQFVILITTAKTTSP